MDTPAFGFFCEGFFCYQSADDPTQFYYVPSAFLPDGASGAPQLIPTPSGARLMLEAALFADPQRLEALKQSLPDRVLGKDPALIELDPIPPSAMQVEGASLVLQDETGRAQVLQTVQKVSAPRYQATFSVDLSTEQAERAKRALAQQQSGILRVELRYAVSSPVKVSAAIVGNATALLVEKAAQLASEPSETDANALLSQALQGAALRLETQQSPAGEPSALTAQAEEEAKRSAALLLRENLRQLKLAKKASEDAPKPSKPRWPWSRTPPAPAAPPYPPSGYQAEIRASATQAGQARVPKQDSSSPWIEASTDLGAWAKNRA
jgi:hypothetical protein